MRKLSLVALFLAISTSSFAAGTSGDDGRLFYNLGPDTGAAARDFRALSNESLNW